MGCVVPGTGPVVAESAIESCVGRVWRTVVGTESAVVERCTLYHARAVPCGSVLVRSGTVEFDELSLIALPS